MTMTLPVADGPAGGGPAGGGPADDGPTIAVHQEGERWTLVCSGRWTTATVGRIDTRLRAALPPAQAEAVIDVSAVDALDTAGAWLVYRTLRALKRHAVPVNLIGATAAQASLIETVANNDQPCPGPPPARNAVVDLIANCGRSTLEVIAEAAALVSFLGQTLTAIGRAILQPRRIRLTALVSHMEQVGLNALPIVGLLSFLIGVVLAFQGADQLARFGAEIFTVNLVGIAVLREMGGLLTTIILAGRTGSAYTAQIGTMKVNEEVDAMRTMGLDPMDVLVLPRVLALMITLPLLTFYADVMGLLGGAIMANITLDISLFQFARQINAAVPFSNLVIGLIKAPIFAFIIGLIGCFEGLRVGGSAESVGRLTTRAVVEAIFLVIVIDALFSVLFSVLGI